MYPYYIPSMWLKERQTWDKAKSDEAAGRNVRNLVRALLTGRVTWEELETILDA
jgi:hypothetical protein